jgi:flagellar basal-body rod protein FlgF
VDQLKLVNPPEADLKRGGDGYFRLAGGNALRQILPVRVARAISRAATSMSSNRWFRDDLAVARQYEMQTRMLSPPRKWTIRQPAAKS